MDIGVWVPYSNTEHTFYHRWEQDCFDLRLGPESAGFPVIPYRTGSDYIGYSQGSTHNALRLFTGQQVYIRKNREPKKPAPKPKESDTGKYEHVKIETYNRRSGELIEMVMEYRKVYESSRGRYIKTRGSGRVYLTSDNPPYVRYG